MCVVTAYGKILPKDVLEVPPHGCVNVHASLLPRFRGAAPIQWAIAHGDAETGVALMRMDEGLDTGPVIAMKRLPIAPEETSASLHEKLSALGGEILRESLPAYLRGELKPVPQPSEGSGARAHHSRRRMGCWTSRSPRWSWSAGCAPSRRGRGPTPG